VLTVPSARAMAQEQDRGDRGGDRGGPGGRGNFDPEQIRQQIAQRMKERIGASDEEWSVLQPKVEKVMQLQRRTASGGGMGMLFGRGGRGGGGPGGGDRGDRGGDRGDRGGDRGDRGGDRGDRRGPGGGLFGGDDDSPVAQARRELQRSIEANANADELKAKIAAFREARTKAREELTQAQQELRELLTMKQEAALVMMGMLE
jgi:hypothetical protein